LNLMTASDTSVLAVTGYRLAQLRLQKVVEDQAEKGRSDREADTANMRSGSQPIASKWCASSTKKANRHGFWGGAGRAWEQSRLAARLRASWGWGWWSGKRRRPVPNRVAGWQAGQKRQPEVVFPVALPTISVCLPPPAPWRAVLAGSRPSSSNRHRPQNP